MTKLEEVLAWLHGHVGELAGFRRGLAKSAIVAQLKQLKVSGCSPALLPAFLAGNLKTRKSLETERQSRLRRYYPRLSLWTALSC